VVVKRICVYSDRHFISIGRSWLAAAKGDAVEPPTGLHVNGLVYRSHGTSHIESRSEL
jgi:hypothetical protein